ncbi:hypothetical protein [Actinacidiphila acidipaludis]|uniref:Uncharacterized protein n=1 Tax=Actinacidiphila acidipaludis TaxID=2873382 RepID=A0ABS7Q4E3_9ACTN|nr:hypothetical protein [Streptomyces acidipaludis]MBY8878021.1 hypothetical protein [Streptomyces acidipaludis]
MIINMDARVWLPGERTGGSLDEVFQRVRDAVPSLAIECLEGPLGTDDERRFFLRVGGSLEAVEVESRPGGRPPFIISDEYQQLDAVDPVSASAAVLDFLKA